MPSEYDPQQIQLATNTIRCLAADAVEKAKSGHPGTPMGLADIAFEIFTRYLRHDPHDPEWLARDRFILSGGHASTATLVGSSRGHEPFPEPCWWHRSR